MAPAIITLEKLLEKDSTLLSYGLGLPTNFFANPAWNEMIFLDEDNRICLHPFGKSYKEMLGRRIILPLEFAHVRGQKELTSLEQNVILANKDGKLNVTFKSPGEVFFGATQMLFGYDQDYFKAEVISYQAEIMSEASTVLMRFERVTSYFDAAGIEIKRDQATSMEYLKSQQKTSKLAIFKNYQSALDQIYSSKDSILLPKGSSITRMTIHRDQDRPDISWIGPKEDKLCVNLAKSTRPIDARLVMGAANEIVPSMPEELSLSETLEFINASSGPLETKIALAKRFGEQGMPWIKKHEQLLEKK